MLPPDLAAFGFALDAAGDDAALAARTESALRAAGGRHVAVVGAQREGLVAALARTGLDVTAFDGSRAALARTRDALAAAGLAGRVTLFAADVRDLDLPGGADAVLVPSAAWRMLLHGDAHRAALQGFRRALHGPALLLLDLDRVPPLAESARTPLRDGPGRRTWWAERSGAVVRVGCAEPEAPGIPLDLSAVQPEDALEQVRTAGFTALSVLDAADGAALRSDSARMWLVAARTAA